MFICISLDKSKTRSSQVPSQKSNATLAPLMRTQRTPLWTQVRVIHSLASAANPPPGQRWPYHIDGVIMFVECATSLVLIIGLQRFRSSRGDGVLLDIASSLRLRVLKRGMMWRWDWCRNRWHSVFDSELILFACHCHGPQDSTRLVFIFDLASEEWIWSDLIYHPSSTLLLQIYIYPACILHTGTYHNNFNLKRWSVIQLGREHLLSYVLFFLFPSSPIPLIPFYSLFPYCLS